MISFKSFILQEEKYKQRTINIDFGFETDSETDWSKIYLFHIDIVVIILVN